MHLQQMTFENIVAKGEIAQQFLLSLCFNKTFIYRGKPYFNQIRPQSFATVLLFVGNN